MPMTLTIDQQVECCIDLLNARLADSEMSQIESERQLLSAAVHYLSVAVVDPGDKGALRRVAERHGTEVASVLRLLTPIRSAIAYRRFLGELVRGEVALDARYDTREGRAPSAMTHVAPTQLSPAAANASDDSMRLWPKVRHAVRERFGRSFSGTLGLNSYADRDESPE